MSPTILVAGATGNTGKSVVRTLSQLLSTTSGTFSDYRILATTRSPDGAIAKELADLPHVSVVEQNWVEITPDWLRQHDVVRAFIASHNQPNQFAEESTFHVAALQAGVKYVVRISTTAANVRPDFGAYYPRSHWAIEALLGSPEFESLHWTSLQPNIFTTLYLLSSIGFIKTYRETGKQVPLGLIADKDAPVGVVDADDVGTFAAHLLATEDTTKHNKAKYILNGPEDVTGQQVVDMVEKEINAKVEHVRYRDMSLFEHFAAQSSESPNVLSSIRHAPVTAWHGECSASTTSPEVLEIAAPKGTPVTVFEAMLRG